MCTLEEKLKIIESSTSFDDVKNSGILPEPCIDEGYYFVSYAHRDFKRVIPEILSLQEDGVKIWYDRGLETGISWHKDVCRKIASFRCKGVIVFGSDSFCASESCAREIEQIAESNKSALLIQLDSCTLEGLFPIISLPYDSSIEEKKSALRQLPLPELYEFEVERFNGTETCAMLVKVNDPNIKRAEIPAFVTKEGNRYPVRFIGDRVFAYCYNLYEVIIPDGWSYIGHGAFANCYSLQRVVFGHPYTRQAFNLRRHYGTVTYSFMNCTSLVSVEMASKKGREFIAFDNAFWNCSALEEVNLGNKGIFMENCFKKCISLKRVYLGKSQAKEDFPGIFYGCTSLEHITLPKNMRIITQNVFAHCESLHEIHLPRSMKGINETAFEGAKSLKTVIVDGKINFPGKGKRNLIEEVFPYAETFHIKKGLKYTFSEKFTRLPDERKGYITYGRTV